MFEDSGGPGGKQADERRAKVDPMSHKYVQCQRTGNCLRKFKRQVFRPDPRVLGLPGFSGQNSCGLDVSWVVEGEYIQPEAGKCCSSSSCQVLGSNSNVGCLTNTEKASAESCHHLILNVLRHETSTAEEILGHPPGQQSIRCWEDDKVLFCAFLEEWRTNQWEALRSMAPMFSKNWVLGEYSMKKLVNNTRLIGITNGDRINRQWVRALIDTVANDATVDDLSSVIRRFHDGFFERHCKQDFRPAKRQKVSGSSSQQPSLATSMFTQDSYLDPDYPLSQHYDPGPTNPSQNKQQWVGRLQTAVNVSNLLYSDGVWVLTLNLGQMPQTPVQQLSLERTWLLPEPQLVSQPPSSMLPLLTCTLSQPPNGASAWNYSSQQPAFIPPAVSGSQYSPNIDPILQFPTQPTPVLSPFSQPSPGITPTPSFLPLLHPPFPPQALSFPSPTEEM